MTDSVRVGDIDLPQDLRYERRAYRVRQAASIGFGLLLVGGLLGLFGRSGVLSETTASDGALTVGYERFLRAKTPTELEVRLGAGPESADVAISQGLLEDFRVEGYSVEPESTTALPDRVVYTFAQRPPSRVSFSLEPERAGRHRGTVYGPGGAAVEITQWVWP